MSEEQFNPYNNIPNSQKESIPELNISQIDSESRDDISSYYQFEIDQGFSQIHPKSTFDSMVDYRQKQIKENKLKIVMAKEGDQLVSTAVVVLENGTMGKEIKEDEAWAAGTVVDSKKRGSGIGEKIAEEQDRIAKEAGKKSILTCITNDNHPSMRLYMKVGYRLDGIDERKNETNYTYRKNIDAELMDGKMNWKEKVKAGELAIVEGKINDSSPKEVLINPNDIERVQNALNSDYEGVYLLRPEDFKKPSPIDNNLIVFTKKDK